MPNFWKAVNKVIEESDVILMLLDARLVDETRNIEIENKVKGHKKPLIYVITKCDLVDPGDIKQKKQELGLAVFVSAKDHHGMKMLRDKILIQAQRLGKKTAKVGVLGYPNVGKSSLINSLKGKKAASTSSLSGHTKGVQNVRADNRIMLLDTPGVIPYKEKDFMKHAFIGTLDHIKIKEPDLVVMELLERFPGKIERSYGVKEKEDKEETIEDIALKTNTLKKGGIPDVMRISQKIIRDWQAGKIR